MTAVFDRYPNGGGEMLLALALADHAHDDGQHIYPSIENLAVKTRQSVRSVQYQLRAMESAGWLILTNEGDGRRGQHREYRINAEWLKGADFASLKIASQTAPMGANDDGKGCNGVHPLDNRKEPSVNRPAAKRASRLPEDWVLPKSWGEWAISEYPAWDADKVRTIATLFRNYWVAKSKDATKLDWFATWQNWCIKEAEKSPNGGKAAVPGVEEGEWWTSSPGIDKKGAALGLAIREGEIWPNWKIRVFLAAGDGPWLNDLPQGVRQEGFKSAGAFAGLPNKSHQPQQGNAAHG